jgi:hypothetical protein
MLTLRRIVFVLLVLIVAGFAAAVWSGNEPFYLGGIQVNEADHGAWVEALADSDMNTVEVTVYARQGDWDSAHLWFEEEEPWVVAETRAAKARGLKVVLVLRVALDHAFEGNKFFWHGMIMPRSDDLVSEWFRLYGDFVRQWARIAHEEDIDVLAIASELNALTNTVPVAEIPVLEEYWANQEKVARENAKILAHGDVIEEREIWVRGNEGYEGLEPFLDDRSAAHARWARQVAWLDTDSPLRRINARRGLLRQHWTDLIQRTREVYAGPLTYAANFDQYEMVDFWDQLDLLGINAYFPLRGRDLPDTASEDRTALFAARWIHILSSIRAFGRAQGIAEPRVLFTELGYVRRANSTIQPWAAHGFSVLSSTEGPRLMVWEDQPEDPHERAQAVAGLYQANLDLGGDLLAGILYWKLSTEPAHLEVEPFVLIIGDRADDDPLLREMQRFTRRLRWDRRKRGALAWVRSYLPG